MRIFILYENDLLSDTDKLSPGYTFVTKLLAKYTTILQKQIFRHFLTDPLAASLDGYVIS